ncbi:cytochrome c oxidase subunit 3 family protein [Zhongshania marina]|uniref:Cytochrome c oxidase subunit 3 family protein n=1 Tax=Zhongshania marina TaxID=2304603 RepID=A0ABX9W8A9_9GAMM|nr:cytochrome c oxidase subunit 3 family protein [Zhongshania marina]
MYSETSATKQGEESRTLATPKRKTRVPGEVGIWVFLFGDLGIFTALFGTWMYYRARNVDEFLASQATLSETLATLNTILLLISSWCVVMALESARSQKALQARHFLLGASACGIGFSLVKIYEYWSKFDAGITILTNDFYMLYFMATGMHFLHVIIGLGVLSIMWLQLCKSRVSERDIAMLETGATYWHMVDLLWIILFPLIYLMG